MKRSVRMILAVACLLIGLAAVANAAATDQILSRWGKKIKSVSYTHLDVYKRQSSR